MRLFKRAEPSEKAVELSGLARPSENDRIGPKFRTGRVIATALIASSLAVSAELILVNSIRDRAPKATATNTYPYITESGVSFGQDETHLTVVVKAVPQKINGVTTYLLNALTEGGSWFQIGLTYFKDYNGLTGFYLTGEVFNPSAQQVYPKTHPGAAFYPPFDCPIRIKTGDKVLLSIDINKSGAVVAEAKDLDNRLIGTWIVGQTASRSFSGSRLVNKYGYFTGDIVEIHQSKSNVVGEFNKVNFNIGGANSPLYANTVWAEIGHSVSITAQKPKEIVWTAISDGGASTSLDGISATYSNGTFTSSSAGG